MSGNGVDGSRGIADTSRRARRRELVIRAKSQWRRNKSPDAADFLARHATIRGDRSFALDLAYEEYCIRTENGEQLDAVDFCRAFPTICRSLKRQIEVDRAIRHLEPLSHARIDWPKPGDPLMGFRVVGQISQGTFARVYLCAQAGIGDRQVVVKVAYRGAPEADTMGKLNHPNIISVHSVEVDDVTDLSFICMPFRGRSTLFDLIDIAYAQSQPPRRANVILEAARSTVRRGDRHQSTVPRKRIRPGDSYVTGILLLAIQIAEALEHAHEAGVLHGDLKPSNVVLSTDGMPLVVDFNLSYGPEVLPLMTGGTLPYMPPEVTRTLLMGPDEPDRPDARSDIFSLGAVLYELLSGRLPFLPGREPEGMTAATHLLHAQSQGAQPLRELNPAVDARLSDFVRSCLAFDPADRPQTMSDVCAQLQDHLSQARRTFRFLRDRRALVIRVALCGVGVAGGAVLINSQQPSVAEREYKKGLRHFERHEFRRAIERFSVCVQREPKSVNAIFARGCSAIHQFEHDPRDAWLDMAFRDFTSAAQPGTDPRVYVGLSVVCLKRNQFEGAVHTMENAITSGVQSKEVWNNLGYAYSKLARVKLWDKGTHEHYILSADSALRRAIEIDDDIWQSHLSLAILELYRYRVSDDFIPRDGLDAIRIVLRQSERNDATYFFASKISGVIAEADQNPDLWTECIEYLELAVEHGLDLRVHKSIHPYTHLSEDSRFKALLKRTPGRRMDTGPERIILPGVLSPNERM